LAARYPAYAQRAPESVSALGESKGLAFFEMDSPLFEVFQNPPGPGATPCPR